MKPHSKMSLTVCKLFVNVMSSFILIIVDNVLNLRTSSHCVTLFLNVCAYDEYLFSTVYSDLLYLSLATKQHDLWANFRAPQWVRFSWSRERNTLRICLNNFHMLPSEYV